MQNQTNRDAISNFMKMTGASTVYLYGGAAIDRYLNPEAEIMDYDIAIQNPDEYVAVVDKLKKEGFDVGNTRVAFNLSTVAKHPKYGIFDLACMDIEKNGIYNLEKFYVEYSEKYPWGKAVDRFNTVHCLREGRIIPINNPDEEKAYDLLRRFSVLAGKYGFSLDRNGLNGDTIDTLHRRLQETPLAKGSLEAPVEIPAHGNYGLTGNYAIEIDNPLLLLSAGAGLKNGNGKSGLNNITLDINATIKQGGLKKNFKYRKIPLSGLLN